MTRPRRTASARATLVLATGLFVPSLHAAAASAPFATLESSAGEVTVLRLGQPQAATPAMPLQLNDVVVTKQGRASVRFDTDGTVMRIGPDSRVQIDESATERDIKLFFGRIWAHVIRWKERPTRFTSGSTIAAIRGTELSLAVASDGNETQLAVLEGKVEAKTDAGSRTVEGGQVVTGAKGKAPVVAQVRPLDAVRWALYYPPVLSKPGADSAAGRAAARLASGSVDEAVKELDQALAKNANDSDALALKAAVAVAANRADEAQSTAQKAVAANPKSAAAQVALSYAQQATFDLEGARASLEKAIALEPGDALAWARLAEIRSSLGRSNEALAAAHKAAELDPGLARTQTVLGFANLNEVKLGEAEAAFKKAIELDGSDPLPRLGLGLARIRDGKLADGGKEIEAAVALDPGGSLLRSYLGKAYFEQKRETLVAREYDLAKKNDPKDPTPYLYDAIAKQTTNRPVEALEDVQQAIELNDNRAVYRSRLLLDSDLAARSASLGRIYTDLGFQDLGLVEGWSSVSTDPSNYSAHRLLADNYAALPRHEIARVSELFQSQMLQPLNTTPIQPSLGESNLFLISAQGPGALSFNEFNPLFNRNQVNVQGGFLAAEDSTFAGEGIVSGIYDKFSFSGGYSGYNTDGFRENASQDDKIATAFAQFELSQRTSLQAEVRHRDLETGDLDLHFTPGDFSTLQNEHDKTTSVRVGLRQELGPGTTLLASYMHSDKTIAFALPDPTIAQTFTHDRDENANSVEGQLLWRAPKVKLVAGAGYFDIGAKETTVFAVDDPEFGIQDTTLGDSKIKHTNLYAYAYWSPVKELTLTLGASGDLFDETGTFTDDVTLAGLPPSGPTPVEPPPVLGKKDQFNPKLGVSYTASSGTTLRGTWFRALKRTLVTDQTLEPTQVAGFNQFFDDVSATKSDVWGLAIDQKLGRRAFAGGEYSERDLTIPILLLENGVTWTLNEFDGKEKTARAYVFGTPHPWLTLGAEYSYENFDRDPGLQGSYTTVKTHRVPLSVRFFHPSGFSAYLGTTYLKQEGEFRTQVPLSNDFVPGKRDFWIVDAAVRYRLPKRYGFVAAGVNNLTDETSTYEATDPKNLGIRPGRVVYARVVVALP